MPILHMRKMDPERSGTLDQICDSDPELHCIPPAPWPLWPSEVAEVCKFLKKKKSMFQALVEGCHMLVPAPPHKGSEGTAAWEIRNKGPGQ